jgi:hypothetical protein
MGGFSIVRAGDLDALTDPDEAQWKDETASLLLY